MTFRAKVDLPLSIQSHLLFGKNYHLPIPHVSTKMTMVVFKSSVPKWVWKEGTDTNGTLSFMYTHKHLQETDLYH